MTPPILDAPNLTSPLVCRPARSQWAFVVFFGIFGLLPLFLPWSESRSPHPDMDLAATWLIAGLYGLFFLLPAILAAIWLLRARVIADNNGLRWRSLFTPWRSALWADVTDYGERLSPTARTSSAKHFVVKTDAGQVKFHNDWVYAEALCAFIERNALSARVQQWGIFGTRLEDDWPRVFTYQSRRKQWEAVSLAIFGLGYSVFCFWLFAPDIFRQYQQGAGVRELLLASLAPLFFCSFSNLGILVAIKQNQTFVRYSSQRIIVDPEGITYEEDAEKIRFAWSEITDYFITNDATVTAETRYVILTPRGSIEFLLLMQDAPLLKAIVQRYATAAPSKAWKAKENIYDLGGTAAKWSGGRVGEGQRIYHYRTRWNRLGLLCLACVGGLPMLLFVIIMSLGWPPSENPVFVAAYTDVSVIVYLWVLWRYRTAQVRTDAEGITQHTIWSKKRLDWGNVQAFRMVGLDGFRFGRISGTNGRRLWFWAAITDVEELKEEVTWQAVRAQTRSWEDTAPQSGV